MERFQIGDTVSYELDGSKSFVYGFTNGYPFKHIKSGCFLNSDPNGYGSRAYFLESINGTCRMILTEKIKNQWKT